MFQGKKKGSQRELTAKNPPPTTMKENRL